MMDPWKKWCIYLHDMDGWLFYGKCRVPGADGGQVGKMQPAGVPNTEAWLGKFTDPLPFPNSSSKSTYYMSRVYFPEARTL